MEISLLDSKGIPDGGFLVVRAGNIRQQTPVGLHSGKLTFPAVASASGPFKAELLVPLHGAAFGSGLPDLSIPPFSTHAKLQSKGGGIQVMLQVMRVVTSPPLAQPHAVGTHDTALDARAYLDEHNLLEWLQQLMSDLIRDRPSNPWSYIEARMARRTTSSDYQLEERQSGAFSVQGPSVEGVEDEGPQRGKLTASVASQTDNDRDAQAHFGVGTQSIEPSHNRQSGQTLSGRLGTDENRHVMNSEATGHLDQQDDDYHEQVRQAVGQTLIRGANDGNLRQVLTGRLATVECRTPSAVVGDIDHQTHVVRTQPNNSAYSHPAERQRSAESVPDDGRIQPKIKVGLEHCENKYNREQCATSFSNSSVGQSSQEECPRGAKKGSLKDMISQRFAEKAGNGQLRQILSGHFEASDSRSARSQLVTTHSPCNVRSASRKDSPDDVNAALRSKVASSHSSDSNPSEQAFRGDQHASAPPHSSGRGSSEQTLLGNANAASADGTMFSPSKHALHGDATAALTNHAVSSSAEAATPSHGSGRSPSKQAVRGPPNPATPSHSSVRGSSEQTLLGNANAATPSDSTMCSSSQHVLHSDASAAPRKHVFSSSAEAATPSHASGRSPSEQAVRGTPNAATPSNSSVRGSSEQTVLGNASVATPSDSTMCSSSEHVLHSDANAAPRKHVFSSSAEAPTPSHGSGRSLSEQAVRGATNAATPSHSSVRGSSEQTLLGNANAAAPSASIFCLPSEHVLRGVASTVLRQNAGASSAEAPTPSHGSGRSPFEQAVRGAPNAATPSHSSVRGSSEQTLLGNANAAVPSASIFCLPSEHVLRGVASTALRKHAVASSAEAATSPSHGSGRSPSGKVARGRAKAHATQRSEVISSPAEANVCPALLAKPPQAPPGPAIFNPRASGVETLLSRPRSLPSLAGSNHGGHMVAASTSPLHALNMAQHESFAKDGLVRRSSLAQSEDEETVTFSDEMRVRSLLNQCASSAIGSARGSARSRAGSLTPMNFASSAIGSSRGSARSRAGSLTPMNFSARSASLT